MDINDDKIGFVLFSASVGGTERRISNLFKFLSDRYPGQYHLILNIELYKTLQKANYGLDKYDNVHIVKKKFWLDKKKDAHATFMKQFIRPMTLFHYRSIVKKIIKQQNIKLIQLYLEMVPFLGVFPIRNVKTIVSLVSHLPEYYDGKTIKSRLLLHALRRCDRVDALYRYIADSLLKVGISKKKINYPGWNFVNHVQFHPEKKEKIVTFSSRFVYWKKPLIMVDAVLKAIPSIDKDVKFYIMGKGELLKDARQRIRRAGYSDRIFAGFQPDPSRFVNKSMVHASVEEFDNFTNQSLLEGMAAGCAIIATDVGHTKHTVTNKLGVLVNVSSDEIAAAIVDLLKNPKKIKKMGIESRKKILKDHSIDKYLAYIRILQNLDNNIRIADGVKTAI